MAFIAIFHGLSNQVRRKAFYNEIASVRAEKVIKTLQEEGVTADIIQKAIELERERWRYIKSEENQDQ